MTSGPGETTSTVLYRSDRTLVERVWLDGVTAIRKQALGPGAMARIQHEVRLLERLSGVSGVARQLPGGPTEPTAITYEDQGGRPLDELIAQSRFAPADLPELALALARILVDVHRAGVMHRDVNPANIVVTDAGLILIDFDLATTFAEVRPAFTHYREITGRLPYLAPEQTGRTGLPVDLRADLYGLGATLYELAAGEPPFGDGDQLRLMRDILAREPEPLRDVPAGFAEIVARLLEKGPERRYQSAEGLAHDLHQLCTNPDTPVRIGERDFPSRLSPPAGLVGRDTEITALHTALRDACRTTRRGVLVAGAPGVGKSALIEQLRPMVTADGGWYVSGKYDQFRHDTASGAVVQAMAGLARLLLAEPEAELVAQRERIIATLGPNVGLAALAVPEFAALLGSNHPVPVTEPGEAEARLRQTALDLLRAVSSADRPIVMVLDDLQWANQAAISILDAILLHEDMRGLLVVGAYRDGEVDATHPLTATMSRWERHGVGPPLLKLGNLAPSDLAVLLGGMLRLPPAPADALARTIGERTGGNPFDTVELVNALRRDGALRLEGTGWGWDPVAVRQYIGHGDVVDLLRERIDRLPGPTRELLGTMSCLGGDVRLGLLGAASGMEPEQARDVLTPALEDALLVMDENDAPGVRFRHDRVQQAAREGLDQATRHERHLVIARRLVADPLLRSVAAEQYLAVDTLTDVDERRLAAQLFVGAAAGASRASNHVVAERYLKAATVHLRAVGDPIGVDLSTARHAALYNMGHFDDADAVYQAIVDSGTDPMELVDAACVQICSLTNRFRIADALTLGLELLERLGVAGPGDDVRAEVERRIEGYYAWLDTASVDEDLHRPELTDRRALAVARLIRRLGTAAYWTDVAMMLWLGIEGQRLWVAFGPCPELIATMTMGGAGALALRGDFTVGVAIARHALAVGDGRGYEFDAAQARYYYTSLCAHWDKPIEDIVPEARTAREGLVRGGDLQTACFTFYPSVFDTLDFGSIEDLDAEVEAALDFSTRTGNEVGRATHQVYRQFCRVMRGETESESSFSDDNYDAAAEAAANPRAAIYLTVLGMLAAALYGDDERLISLGARSRILAPLAPAVYASVYPKVIGALALARELHGAPVERRPELLAEFDALRTWLAGRAEDAPANFRHLGLLLDAERAWALADFRTAAAGFDAAMRAVGPSRPWHRALITERTGLFHLAVGMQASGRRWLADARGHYQRWGAARKVRTLDRTHPFLRGAAALTHRDGVVATVAHSTSVRSDDIDMLAILRASQALSSETDLDRLHTSIIEQMSAITGATQVEVYLPDDATGEWTLPANGPDRTAAMPVDEAAERGLLPLTAFRYVERTQQPLLVEDAAADDRFSRDPYLAGVDRCSLLLVPVLHHGTPRAIVVLENRLSSGAFAGDRLDAVNLIAGQLAVSLNNAMLYRHLETKVAERTTALQAANEQLAALSITDPLTGLANRRRFDEVLEASWRDAMSGNVPMGIAMIDIDHFKLYNDHYGHQAGDECLRGVADALTRSMRQGTDVVCRYGGEEFAVIVPGGDEVRTHRIAERARAAVEALATPHARAAAGIVTLSVGVASVRPVPGNPAQLLVKTADDALYDAKRQGRNRVHVASQPDS